MKNWIRARVRAGARFIFNLFRSTGAASRKSLGRARANNRVLKGRYRKSHIAFIDNFHTQCLPENRRDWLPRALFECC